MGFFDTVVVRLETFSIRDLLVLRIPPDNRDDDGGGGEVRPGREDDHVDAEDETADREDAQDDGEDDVELLLLLSLVNKHVLRAPVASVQDTSSSILHTQLTESQGRFAN